MRMHKPTAVVPLRIAQVPIPTYPTLGNIKPGGVLLSGKLASAVDSLKLDTRDMPPSRFKSVRDDISRFSPIPVSRVALRHAVHAYVGIIDSNNEPFMFSLNSQGMMVKRAPNDENAWQMFDQYMDAERASALETRRKVAAMEQATLIVKADIKHPGSRGGTFYFDKNGKVVYGKQPMHDHHVHVELPAKHKLEGDAAKLHKHVRKQNPATVHEARKHVRSWIRDNYDASAKQIDQTTAQMLRYFHEEGALHLHPHEVEPTAAPSKDVPHFFKRREALALPVLPTPFDVEHTRLLVDGKPVALSADAEHACYAFAKRFLVNEGKVKGHAEFVRGFEKSLRSMGVPKGDYDYKNFVKRITSEPEKAKAPKNKEAPTPKTHPHLFIKQDGQTVRLSDVRTPAGNFYTGKGKRGTWARALREEDITMNVAAGGAPKGWKGKTVFDPTKDYYLTWRHPDTDELGYVYPSRANAYQKKFEEASALGLNIDRIRDGVVSDIEKRGSPETRVAALCTYLIDKERFRVGEESHAEDTGTFGIGSLRVEHVKVDGKHVIFDFPGKKDEPWRRVVDFSKLPAALSIIKDCLKGKHAKDRIWEGNGWSVDSKDINEYLDRYSKDGVKFTAKMFRTFHANRMATQSLKMLEKMAEFFDWDDTTVKKLYKGFNVSDKAGKKILDRKYTPWGKTVREVLDLEENHGAKGKGKAIIGVLPTIATRLGHTVSSCRNSYIDPVVVVPFAAKHGWDERTLGEKKTRDDLPVHEKKNTAKPAKQPKAPDSPYKAFLSVVDRKLKGEERSAAHQYANDGASLNVALRSGKPLSDTWEKTVRHLDSAIAHTKLPFTAKVERAVGNKNTEHFKKMAVGTEFSNDGYTSSSGRSGYAAKEHDDVIMHITASAGVSALPIPPRPGKSGKRMSDEEQEIIFGRNQKFKVTKKEVVDHPSAAGKQRVILHVEAVPHSATSKVDDSQFTQIVQSAADAAPAEHGFGDRKVFIHHVYETAKPKLKGMDYADFKKRIVAAHQASGLELSRADFVGAMDSNKVDSSETHAPGGAATFHFIKRSDVKKAVPILHRPGKRGGHFHFNSKGKVVYDSHITYNAPEHSWRGFDNTAFKRVIEEHRHVEAAHGKHVKRLTAAMKELRVKKQAATKPHHRARIQNKIVKLRAQQIDHRAVVRAAREQRMRVTKQQAAAKQKHLAAQRALTQKKKRATSKKQQREAIMTIGGGMGIGTHTVKEKPSKVAKKPERAVPREEPRDVEEHKEPEPVKEPAKPAVIQGTIHTWKPGDENRRREVVHHKQTSHHEDDKQKRQAELDSERRARERWAKQRAEQEEKTPKAEAVEEKPKVKKRGLLSRMFGRKDGQIQASFVDSANIFKTERL